jgi:(p)ppGpp synthase/HD superfamily hydrolase
MEEKQVSFEVARKMASASTIFTTHTPVPAGNDIFPLELMDRYFAAYSAELAVFANNRTGVLMDVTRVFTERQIDIKSVNARINKQGDRTTIVVSFDTHGVSELNYLMSKLRQVEGVLNIERTTG